MKKSNAQLITDVPEHTHGSRQPAVLERLTGQVPGRAKVPSVLLYNRKGVCEKWGTQTEDLSKPDRTRLRDGDLIRCEWFKRE
jgi:hypothetical protein